MASVVTVTMNPSIDISSSVDRVMPIRKLRCKYERRDPGGGGINVARVAKRLGTDVRAIFPAGGSPGRLLRRLLDQEGVASDSVEIAGDTREDFTILDESTGEQFRFVFPGPAMDARELDRVQDLVASLDPPPAFIVASGSLPPGAPEDLFAAIARIARQLGSRYVLDTSGPALKRALDEGIHLIKPSLRELSELVGKRLDTEEEWQKAAVELVGSGKVDVVVLTLGAAGALLATRDGVFRSRGLAVKVASVVGAGDCFLGGMVSSLADGKTMLEAFRMGMAAGSAAVQMPGTALCGKDGVDRILPMVAPPKQCFAV
jgi:6-phosphofructokinase 2